MSASPETLKFWSVGQLRLPDIHTILQLCWSPKNRNVSGNIPCFNVIQNRAIMTEPRTMLEGFVQVLSNFVNCPKSQFRRKKMKIANLSGFHMEQLHVNKCLILLGLFSAI